jgi:hypothetical protein
MYPRPSTISIRLSASQAEDLYWELIGSLDHYRDTGITLEPNTKQSLLSAISQLEVGINRSASTKDPQLDPEVLSPFLTALQKRKSNVNQQEVA